MTEQKEQFDTQYQAGQVAFERGQYRQSVQHLEQAAQLVAPGTRISGEVRMWLVSAYQAAGRLQESIELCRQLTRHPQYKIRKQAEEVLYILEAPRLKRPQEWMIQIPDLGKAAETVKYVPDNNSGQKKPRPKPVIEPVDLSQVNTKDNQFIWVALGLVLLLLGGVLWLS